VKPRDSAKGRYGSLRRYLTYIEGVPGWLAIEDVLLMAGLSDLQRQKGIAGNLLEIGAYAGKSAIALGYLCDSGEHLWICDLFENPAPSRENQQEKDQWYPGVSRTSFERNYLEYHAELPHIFQGPSSDLVYRLEPGSFRFVHIDGSHLHEVVRLDVFSAKTLLTSGGVAIFDDYSRPYALGVAAVVWEEILRGGLIPLCTTESKLYGTWDETLVVNVDTVEGWLEGQPRLRTEVVRLLGREVIQVRNPKTPLRSVSEVLRLPSMAASLRKAIFHRRF
jgi:hypothetical protein